jgi:hypothetical protein
MATLETSHTTACDPPAPSAGQTTPSPRLRDCRVQLVLPKIGREMPSYTIFRQGDFLTSIRETMTALATSPTASCGPPAPIPGQPTPSPRLRQCRVQLILPKLMGKCLTYDTFGQAIFDEIFQYGPFTKLLPLQSISPPFALSNTFDNHVSYLPFICSKYIIAFSRTTSR